VLSHIGTLGSLKVTAALQNRRTELSPPKGTTVRREVIKVDFANMLIQQSSPQILSEEAIYGRAILYPNSASKF
jgi:hypothetical protein